MGKKVLKLVGSMGNGEFAAEQLKVCSAAIDIYKVMWLFILGSVIGFLLETVWYYLLRGQYVNRQGVIYGPFSPIYGFALAGFVCILYSSRNKNPFSLFITAALLGSIFEYLCSLLQEQVLGTRSWDYSHKPLNINGRISIEFAVYWGIIGIISIKFIFPFVSRMADYIPPDIGRNIALALCVFLLFDCMISGAAAIRQKERRHGKEASNTVERFLDEHYTDARLAKTFTEIRFVDVVPPHAPIPSHGTHKRISER